MNGRTQTDKLVVVFGGTGFLGRRAVRHLRRREFSVRVASRHPDRGRELFGSDPRIESIEVNIHSEPSIARAVADAYGAVNTVGLYVERGQETFHSVHVEAAHRIAAQAQQAGIERLVHVSGIGSDATSSSLYIRKRGEGESAVRAAFAGAIVVRPAVMFGPDDTFITTIITLLRRFPIYPMFGQGLTRLQPAYVEDVGEAIAQVLKGLKRVPRSSAAARASILTRSSSESSRAQPGLNLFFFPFPSPRGMHCRGFWQYCRVRQLPVIRWRLCKSTICNRRTCRGLNSLEFHRVRSRKYSRPC